MASKGKGARDKGANFERLIVRTFKQAFADQPWAEGIRRGKQSHTADECDVTGVPGLWIECQHADHVTPLKKLEQAERDELMAYDRGTKPSRLCVAITRKTGERAVLAHARLSELYFLRTSSGQRGHTAVDPMVTLSLADFIELYRAHRCVR